MNLIKHFTVFTCTGCGEILGYEGALCERCLGQFKLETKRPCPKCNMPHNQCACSPDSQLFKHALHIAPYRDHGITRKLILGCKKIKNAALFDFIAHIMADKIKSQYSLDSGTILAMCQDPVMQSETMVSIKPNRRPNA